MAPATDLAAKVVAELKEVGKVINDYQEKHKERMVASMARQESKPAPTQQQFGQQRQQRHVRPMATHTLTVTCSCKLSSFSRLPMPW